jgi:hypothetical protein
MESFFNNTDQGRVRTYLIVDGGEDLSGAFPFDYVLRNKESLGISLCINSGIALVKAKDRYYVKQSRNQRASAPSEIISYHQDDLLYSAGWLDKCLAAFTRYPQVCFVSGWKNDHRDHPTSGQDGEFMFKPTLSGVHLMARKSYWYSVEPMTMMYEWNGGTLPWEPHRGGPEKAFDERGNPGPNGKCSRADWYLMIDNPRSPVHSGRFNVALDVVTHIGEGISTWRNG